MNLLALLNHTDLFGPLSEKSKERLVAIALEKSAKKGAVLFMEGDKGEAVFLLASGTVQVFKSGPDQEKSVIIKNVTAGEIFAEVTLFEQDRFPATAMALTSAVYFVFPKRQFLSLLDAPDFRNEFIAILLRKQRYLTERLRSLVTMDVEDKLFHHLLEHFGAKEKIVPGISKKDLAAAIDATPETLSRLLLKLGKQGVLRWQGKSIVLRPGFWKEYGPGK